VNRQLQCAGRQFSQSSGSTEEQMAKEEAAIRAIAESMQKKYGHA
jgi:hypothetical protein